METEKQQDIPMAAAAKMRKKTIVIIFALAVIFIMGLVEWGIRRQQSDLTPLPATANAQASDLQADIIFYYGSECPHCKNVEKFIADNKVAEKISFAKKEVWHNSGNNAEMIEKAKECTLESAKIGVPFLWARGKCYVGEIDVQNFLKQELGMQ
jgi:glutaredoxin